MESYQTAALRTLPMAQICSTVNYEHGPPNLGSSNNVGKNVVFVCPEVLGRVSECNRTPNYSMFAAIFADVVARGTSKIPKLFTHRV